LTKPKLIKKTEQIVKEQPVHEGQGGNTPQQQKLPKKRAQRLKNLTQSHKKTGLTEQITPPIFKKLGWEWGRTSPGRLDTTDLSA
jgi:LAS superfamily LD-carboxypeptidase LdcB